MLLNMKSIGTKKAQFRLLRTRVVAALATSSPRSQLMNLTRKSMEVANFKNYLNNFL